MPLQFGPPYVDKPTAELLGEQLLRNQRPSDAVAVFEGSLSRALGRKLSQAGLQTAQNSSGQGTAIQAGEALAR